MPGKAFQLPKVGFIGVCALTAALVIEGGAQIKVLIFRDFYGFNTTVRITATEAIKTTLPVLLDSTPAFIVDVGDTSSLTPADLNRYQVLILNNTTGIGGLNSAQRDAIMGFSRTKGIIAIRGAADFLGGGNWPEMRAFIGTAYSSWSHGYGKLRTEAVDHPVNAGLPLETWMGDHWPDFHFDPRSEPGMVVLTHLDEESLDLDVQYRMGERPVAWCRENATGGRMYYTSLGARDSIMQKNLYARRQLYNAILWAAHSNPSTIPQAGSASSSRGGELVAARGGLMVTFREEGRHSFAVGTVDGRRVAAHAGTGAREYSMPRLRSGTVYLVAGRSKAGTFSRLVSIP